MNNFILSLLDYIQDFIELLAHYAWSPVSILLLVGTGLLLTIRSKFIQVRLLKTAFNLLIYGPEESQKKHSTHDAAEAIKRDINDVLTEEETAKTTKLSGFQALATVLSGTIGTGNIAGVATAIVMGGPGALFWMWVTAFLGMATKFSSCTLAHHYRQKDDNNNVLGGPMITLSKGLGYNKLANMFAFFMILGTLSTGSMVQANSIVDGATYLMPSFTEHRFIIGCIISFLSGIVIIGGVQRIANVATIVVPFIALAYVGIAMAILIIHYYDIPRTFSLIFQYAFSIKAISGASFWLVIRSGVARGLFASEAGLGTAPIALATLDTKNSVEAGLIGMISPMIDTLLICTMTGLIIIASGAYDPNVIASVSGAQLSQKAFATGFNCIGPASSIIAAWIVGVGLALFAFTTILTWSYYGDRCVSYLFGNKFILPYRILFSIVLILGAILKLEVVWNIADIANVGMAVPNLIAVFLLRHKISELIKNYMN